MSKKTAAFRILGLTALSLGAILSTVAADRQDDPALTRWGDERGSTSRREDPPQGAVVSIQNLAFTPKVIRLKRGQTITWVNRDDFAHTATADDKSFDTGILRPGDRARVTFERTGTFPYYCTPHPFMKASVIVDE